MTMQIALFMRRYWAVALSGLFIAVLFVIALRAVANPVLWKFEWPKTDFDKRSIDLGEIMSGGPPKDGIPSIDRPKFITVEQMTRAKGLSGTEPVIAIRINGDARAYPLRILMWHEIVNDTVGGVPVTVTYCPLCNSAVAFSTARCCAAASVAAACGR